MAQKFAPAVQQNAFCQRAVCFHVCPSVCRRDGLVAHLQINNPHSALYGFAVLVSSAQAAGGARCKKRPPPLIRDLVALALIIAARIFIISFAADEFICRSLRPEFFYTSACAAGDEWQRICQSQRSTSCIRPDTARVKKRPPTGSLFISTTVALSAGAPPCERRCAPRDNLRLSFGKKSSVIKFYFRLCPTQISWGT